MRSTAKVAIVGRPNVGKSTLFNILSGQRRSVVQDRPGVTRDLLYSTVSIWDKDIEIVDTGGVTDAEDTISGLIRGKVGDILHTADLAVVVADGRSGVTSEDQNLVDLVQRSGTPAVLVVNKIDRVEDEVVLSAEFHEFGLDVLPAAFEQRRGLSDLMDWIYPRVPEGEVLDLESDLKIAIIGKPNVGKSSLLNRLAGEDRALVSDIAGTTVDTIDTRVQMGDKNITFIDTAGLRRQSRRHDDLEVVSAILSEKTIQRADLVLLMVDIQNGPTDQDAKILQIILQHHKGVILVANKCDIAGAEYRKNFREQCAKVYHFFPEIWIQFVSVKTGQGMKDLQEKILDYREKLRVRISTSQLNSFFENTIRQAPAPLHGTKIVRFYYLTQTKQIPPSFIAFANFPQGVNNAYRRFLTNKIRKQWGLQGVPIRIFIMKKGRKLDT